MKLLQKTIIYALWMNIKSSNVAPFTTQIEVLLQLLSGCSKQQTFPKTCKSIIWLTWYSSENAQWPKLLMREWSKVIDAHLQCIVYICGLAAIAGQENWLSRRNIPCVTKPYHHKTYSQLQVHIHLHMSILSLHPLSQNMSEHNRDYRTCL